MNEISIIFPNQLIQENPLLSCDCDILLIEDSLFFGNDKYYKYVFHKNKLILLKASIYSYKEYLKQQGKKVLYIENKALYSTTDYLSKYLENKCRVLNIVNPHDYLIMRRLKKFCEKLKIKINVFESPMFITNSQMRKLFLGNSKKPLMMRFYKNQRKEQKILINSDQSPIGGKWSFDEQNRKKLPKNIFIPELKKL